jgi:hypothetical protein
MAVRAAQSTTCPCRLTVMAVDSLVTVTEKKKVLTSLRIKDDADVCAGGPPDNLVQVVASLQTEVSWTAVCTRPGFPDIHDAGTTSEDIDLKPNPDLFFSTCTPSIHQSPGWQDDLAGITGTVTGTLTTSEQTKHPGYTCAVTVTGIRLAPFANAATSKVHADSDCGGNSTCVVSVRLKNGGGIDSHTCASTCK